MIDEVETMRLFVMCGFCKRGTLNKSFFTDKPKMGYGKTCGDCYVKQTEERFKYARIRELAKKYVDKTNPPTNLGTRWNDFEG